MDDAQRKIGPLPTSKIVRAVVLWILLIAGYVAVATTDGGSAVISGLANWVRTTEQPALATFLFSLGLIACLLLPLSPATLLVLVGVSIWGPARTFWLSWVSALVAATISYYGGQVIGRVALQTRVRQTLTWLEAHLQNRAATFLVFFVARAVPNPLYDAWGYAAGMARVPFWAYFVSSALGGAIPLAVVCWIGSRA